VLVNAGGQKFEGVTIVDALSASGLRTIRFLRELEGVRMVYANDISPASHKLMRDNFDLNELDPDHYKLTMQDANLLLLN
jgi:tRNA (guanine26-N2/guanine27-N2)-dimethyltransferase